MDIFFGGKKRTKMLEKGEGAFFTQTLNNSAFPFHQIQCIMKCRLKVRMVIIIGIEKLKVKQNVQDIFIPGGEAWALGLAWKLYNNKYTLVCVSPLNYNSDNVQARNVTTAGADTSN